MDSKDFSKSLKAFSEKIVEGLQPINEKVALNAYALAKNRIINEGTIGEGKSLGGYSTNEMPAFFFKGKALNNSGEAFYEKKKKAGEGISYADWRKANNRPIDHVTLSFSGTTFNDIGVIKQLVDGVKVVTIVGPKNTKVRANGDSTSEIVGYLQDRYGDFIKPNREETEILKATLSNEVNLLIKKSL
jgi:hypothetical protein